MIALLSGVVMVLIVCHLPKTIINIYESYQVHYTDENYILLNDLNFQMIVYGSLKFKPFWGRLVIKCSHTLLGFSSASNIIIYFFKVGYHPATDILCFFYPLGFPVQISSSGWLQQVHSGWGHF